jgi:hypothetical protein
MKEFFLTLFDKGEGICTGNAYATEVHNYAKEGEFFCVNPLDKLRDHGYFLDEKYSEYVPRRADINVSCFRNFIFEMDSIELEDQLKIFRNSAIPFTSVTYSGGKSYHAILSVDPKALGNCHTLMGIDDYKNAWRRLAARIDKEATKLGYKYPDGKNSFVDQSCKNPSRLTRYPDMIRSNGNRQELIQLTERMPQSEFLALLSECPVILSTRRREFDTPENELETVEQFEAVCSPELMRKLKIVDWAGSEGMYPYLLKFTLWAIDETNVSKEAFMEFLDKYTFKSLIRHGYPANKLEVAVDHAYRMKGM